MDFLRKHWLGIAVLVSFVIYVAQMPPRFDAKMVVSASVFMLLFVVWVFRGFIRFVGRAFHHSVTPNQK